MRGYGPGRFSFNVKGGRCEACQGDGLVKIEMHFLPDVYVPCEVCKGRRYNRETLEVRYKGRSIADVLDLTVADALDFFSSQRRIAEKLELLNDVGLGYLHLGQAATTLSGGEAQRVKLATELAKRDTGRTLYILDEPTTGLHFEDVRLLLDVLHRLVDKGNTRRRHRAQPRRDQDRRLDHRPRPRRRASGRARSWRQGRRRRWRTSRRATPAVVSTKGWTRRRGRDRVDANHQSAAKGAYPGMAPFTSFRVTRAWTRHFGVAPKVGALAAGSIFNQIHIPLSACPGTPQMIR